MSRRHLRQPRKSSRKHATLVLQPNPLRQAIRLALIAGAITAGTTPQPAAAFTCPVQSGDTVVITGSDSPAATLCDNEGTIEVDSSGELVNPDTFTLNNFSDIRNDGTLRNQENGTLDNYGTLTNEAGSRLRNYGTLTNHTGGILITEVLSILSNYKYLTNSGTLINQNVLYNYSGGTLTNEAGGALTNAGGLINYGTLNNSGMLTNTGGLANRNTLTNHAGGTLTNRRSLANSGTLSNAGTLDIAATGRVTGSASDGYGTFIQTGGTTLNHGLLKQGTIDIQGGSLAGSGTFASTNDTIQIGAGAEVAPGDPATDPTVTMTFEGDIDIAGALAFEFSSPDDFDVISVEGDSLFQPGSEVDLVFSFTPSVGDTFTFFLSNSLTGFDDINFDVLGLGGLPYRITELNGDLTASVVPVPAALPLFGSALAGFGLMGWRQRRRRVQAASGGIG